MPNNLWTRKTSQKCGFESYRKRIHRGLPQGSPSPEEIPWAVGVRKFVEVLQSNRNLRPGTSILRDSPGTCQGAKAESQKCRIKWNSNRQNYLFIDSSNCFINSSNCFITCSYNSYIWLLGFGFAELALCSAIAQARSCEGKVSKCITCVAPIPKPSKREASTFQERPTERFVIGFMLFSCVNVTILTLFEEKS